jgi:hypothetical protein
MAKILLTKVRPEAARVFVSFSFKSLLSLLGWIILAFLDLKNRHQEEDHTQIEAH